MLRVVFVPFVLGLLMGSGCVDRSGFSFGVVADVQYADKDQVGTRAYRESIDKLSACVQVMNEKELAFVIQLGDIIDGGDNAAVDLKAVADVYNGIETTKYHVLGNHDFSGIGRTEVLETLGMDEAYYDFAYRKWRFVVLDTMDLAVSGGWAKDSANYLMGEKFLNELKNAGASNAVDWNGGVGPAQKAWLIETLNDAQAKGQRVIVFGHNPLQPVGGAYNLWNSEEIVKVLEHYDCVAAYLNGHKHFCEYHWINEKYYVTIDGMVEEAFDKGYSIVTVSDDEVYIEGTGEVPRLTLTLGKSSSAKGD
jgi:hypothetical protein